MILPMLPFIIICIIVSTAFATSSCTPFSASFNVSQAYPDYTLYDYDELDVDAPYNYTCCAYQGLFIGPRFFSESGMTQLLHYWGVLVAHDLGFSKHNGVGTGSYDCFGQYERLGLCPSLSPERLISNHVTPALDGGILYGQNPTWEQELRDPNDSCALKFTPIAGRLPHACSGAVEKEYPPYENAYDVPCAGDARSAQTVQLLGLHTILAREHNYQCGLLNGNYTRVKNRMIALIQKITLYEWLPTVVGNESYIPTYVRPSSWPHEGPSDTIESELAVFKALLTTGGDNILYMNSNDEEFRAPIEDGYYIPEQMYASGYGSGICSVVRGLFSDPLYRVGMQASTLHVIENLAAKTCEAERDAGMLTYAQIMREALADASKYPTLSLAYADLHNVASLSDITSEPVYISAILGLFPNMTTDSEAAEQIGLMEGLLIEDHVPVDGGMIGPLMRYLLLVQLVVKTRDNDKFWFESGNLISADDYAYVISQNLKSVLARHCGTIPAPTDKELSLFFSSFVPIVPPILSVNIEFINSTHTHKHNGDTRAIVYSIVLSVVVIGAAIFIYNIKNVVGNNPPESIKKE